MPPMIYMLYGIPLAPGAFDPRRDRDNPLHNRRALAQMYDMDLSDLDGVRVEETGCPERPRYFAMISKTLAGAPEGALFPATGSDTAVHSEWDKPLQAFCAYYDLLREGPPGWYVVTSHT